VFLEALIEGIYVVKTRPDIVLEALKQEGVQDPRTARAVSERLAKNLREYPLPEPRGVQTAIDSLPVPKARGAQFKDFVDTSLLEEIKASGYIDRLYRKS
jgi:hypothetical protein